VVEGEEDRRLAIQLDGDRPESTNKWVAGWSLQKVLERVGWRFWRCWESSYTIDSESCLRDLLDTLEELEITPIGTVEAADTHMEHRVVTPSGDIEPMAEEDLPLVDLEEDYDPAEAAIEGGDRVMVNFTDDPVRYSTFVISDSTHHPAHGIYHVDDPVAQSLIGHTVDEELEIPFGEKIRTVTIVRIEKLANRALEPQS
jgi:hypothetical protein